MPTIMYAPEIQVVIATRRHGVLDVSADLSQGSLGLNENSGHTFGFTLINHRRKYDGVFTPNDRIAVKMKRITWMQVFAGYLNTVPFFSAQPRSVTLSATCTSKRLQMTPFDPDAQDTVQLLNMTMYSDPAEVDGGLRQRVISLLTEVGKWDATKIHLADVPVEWIFAISSLVNSLSDRINFTAAVVGSGASVAGTSADNVGLTSIQGIGPGTGILRDTSGIATWYDGNKAAGHANSVGALGISTDPSKNPWYCAASFPYADRDGSNQNAAAKQWWAGKYLIVQNSQTNKYVCVEAADFETASSIQGSANHVIDLAPAAFTATGASLGQGTFPCQIRFAPPGAALGPYTPPAGGPAVTGQTSTAATNTPGAPTAQNLLDLAQKIINQTHPRYVFAAQPGADQTAPSAFDCSGFVRWLCLTLNVPGTGAGFTPSDTQLKAHPIALKDALNTPGALVGHYGSGTGGHVAISMGDGDRTIEARGTKAGVGIFTGAAHNSAFQVGGLIPGLAYSGYTDNSGVGQLVGQGMTSFMSPDVNAMMYKGLRALINDQPLLPFVSQLVAASQRSWCTAPNGDFIGWFPDYFGTYNTAGKMIVQPIEIMQDFSINWNDEPLKTHVFTAGAFENVTSNPIPGGDVNPLNIASTAGIATVDLPEVLDAVLGKGRLDGAYADIFTNAQTIYQRFGARVLFQELPQVNLHEAEFFFAVRLFQMNWAQQFSTMIPLTFMPEVFPGMILQFPAYKMQCYVTNVTHHFSFGSGGGFYTNVNVVAPSALDGSSFYGLPIAGLT